MKKIELLTCISILTAAMLIGAVLTACNANSNNNSNDNSHIVTPNPDDENKDPNNDPVVDTKEFDEAVKNATAFIAKCKESENFTISYQLSNNASKIIKYDESKTEIQESGTTIYFAYDTNDKLYKIAQNAENKWTQTEESSHPAPISTLLSTLEGVEWKSYKDEDLTGTTTYNNKTANLSVKLASGTCEYSLTYNLIKATGSIYNVENTTVTLPEFEEEKQEDPSIDYDNLTAADLTAEQKATIVSNVTTALATNIKKNIGRVSGVINKVIGMDFIDNKITLLLDYSNNDDGNMLGLFEYTTNSNVTYKDLLTNNITPANTNMGNIILAFKNTNNNEKTDAVFSKLYQDKVIEENGEYDLQDLQDRGAAVTENHIDLYRINNHQIIHVSLQVRSDGNTKDYITDNLINGQLNGSNGYRINEIKAYKFTSNALYDFNGLEKANATEQEN